MTKLWYSLLAAAIAVSVQGCNTPGTSSATDLFEHQTLCSAFLKEAESGDPSAMVELSRCYYNGAEPDFERSLDKAREWLEASAALGHGPAQVSLAAFILFNAPDDDSKTEALTWARKAKDSNQLGAGTIVVLSTHKDRTVPLNSLELETIGADANAGYLPAALALFAQNFLGDADANENSQSMAFKALQYHFADYGLESAKSSCSDLASEASILTHAFKPEVLRAAGKACRSALDRVTQEAGSYPLVPRP
ncbi:MAG: hypothetical protein AAFQ62_05310 [Pseudomonadota bacterium]